jgi:hypothetical protein
MPCESVIEAWYWLSKSRSKIAVMIIDFSEEPKVLDHRRNALLLNQIINGYECLAVCCCAPQRA